MPDHADRRKLIEQKIAASDERALRSLETIRDAVREYLFAAKGYSEEDIESDREFQIAVDNRKETVSADFIVTLDGRRLLVVKCSPGALESRERHLVAFSRVVDAYPIPFAVLTDGIHARMLDTTTGKLVSDDFESIPDKRSLREKMGSSACTLYPAERIEREKRILLAFEAIRCTEESCE